MLHGAIEFYVTPGLPRYGHTDPSTGARAGGCLGVRMDGEARAYYPRWLILSLG